jgi:hypothetical protein
VKQTRALEILPQISRKGQLTSIAATLLVAGLIRFLVLVFFEVSLLAVIPVTRVVILAFAHPLLVSFVFRIVLVVILVMVLQNWSRHGLCRASADTHTHR